MDSPVDTDQLLHRGSPSNCGDRNKSNHANCIDNPLMKLVDAALRPSSPKMDIVTEAVNNGDMISGMNSSTIVVSSSLDLPVVESKSDEKPTPNCRESSSVVRGTLHDLVSRQEKKMSFAEFLMQCLNNEANHDVIRWMPCGTQFTIKNHRKFTMEQMPQLFKIRNMSSFVRKLTRWGFSRVHEKETGNSDIFKHTHFQRDKPELCKKIRCVSRAISDAAKAKASSKYPPGDSMLMGNSSESSKCGHVYDRDMDFHLVSPRRSISYGSSLYAGRSPHPSESSRYLSYQTPRVSTSYLPPRISPESEKEMMEKPTFPTHSQLKPPQVYTPPLLGRTMSAAAEHELEQILLERHRARMYREHLQASSHHQQFRRRPMNNVSVPVLGPLLESGSERSGDCLSERHFSTGDSFLNLPPDSHGLTAALEKLQREGEFDLDMSPREAMFRAVLHKRQQQLASQHQRGSNGSRKVKQPGTGTFSETQAPARSSPTSRFSPYFG